MAFCVISIKRTIPTSRNKKLAAWNIVILDPVAAALAHPLNCVSLLSSTHKRAEFLIESGLLVNVLRRTLKEFVHSVGIAARVDGDAHTNTGSEGFDKLR